ncbi:GATA transcription factor 18 [Sorghum bicolor]|uniref:GATA transcription factor 18 n=1 Tax=Sorghum bicolor TaxID=4558 RepID=UPI000B425F7D|nr:GATA transcription factor 18 [Sorghum bicolor]|eukprot:XP_002450996.2 GATA transcription factor 18 [Sorghum bicolor]
MTYRGNTHVFDSVPPHKVETILMLLNDYELAPQSAKQKLTNLVPPIVVPQNFDRATAMSRYLKKRKSTMKADYSVRREIALRITRRGGKFAPSEKNSENSVGTEAAELQFCANCRESSEVTPQMRRGPTGAKNFCNACGLAWATYRKIRNVTNAESQHGGSQ